MSLPEFVYIEYFGWLSDGEKMWIFLGSGALELWVCFV